MRSRTLAVLLPLLALALPGSLSAQVAPVPTRYPAPERLVAMADWHGDLAAARRGLRLAGAIDADDHWIGSRLVVVQTGDVVDRGDDERAILDLLARLEREAAAAGGAVIALLGNHELRAVEGNFDDATPAACAAFADLAPADPDSELAALPAAQRGRGAALRPGGVYARQLAGHDVVAIVGRTVFVHGGVRPEHVVLGLERINAETQAWLRGDEPRPAWLSQHESPVWARDYTQEPDADDCARLADVLAALDCDRMVMGHTIQPGGITQRCDGRAWCLDTGASRYFGGPVEVLELGPEGPRILREADAPVPAR